MLATAERVPVALRTHARDIEERTTVENEATREARRWAAAIEDALRAAQSQATLSVEDATALEQAILRGDLEEIRHVLIGDEPLLSGVAGPLARAGVEVGRLNALSLMPSELRRLAEGVTDRAGISERAGRWASDRAGELIANVDEAARKTIREAVARGVAQDEDPRTIARDIRRVIGLTDQQATRIDRARRKMIADGVPVARANRIAARRANVEIGRRAELIARTETMRAVHEGRRELWRELEEAGEVKAERVTRTWVRQSGSALQDICARLNGTTKMLTEEFEIEPPAHPRCSCVVVMSESR